MTQALDGGSIVGRPVRAWRTEAMWWSVKRRMWSKKSSRFCGGGALEVLLLLLLVSLGFEVMIVCLLGGV